MKDTTFSFCLTDLFFSGNYSRLVQVFQRRTFGDCCSRVLHAR